MVLDCSKRQKKYLIILSFLHGDSRDRIVADNDIGTGTVSNILDEWKRAVGGSDYESVRELAIQRQNCSR